MTTRGTWDDSYLQGSDFLPECVVNNTVLASGTLPATAVSGGADTYLTTAAATALTLPTAAAIYQALLGIVPTMNSMIYKLRILNNNAGTLTLTAGTGITTTGSLVVPLTGWRDYVVTITGPNSATFVSVGSGTI